MMCLQVNHTSIVEGSNQEVIVTGGSLTVFDADSDL